MARARAHAKTCLTLARVTLLILFVTLQPNLPSLGRDSSNFLQSQGQGNYQKFAKIISLAAFAISYYDSLRYHLSHQVLRPSRLIHSIPSRTHIVSQLHITLRVLDDGFNTFYVFANRARVSHFEEFGVEDYGAGISRQHLHVTW